MDVDPVVQAKADARIQARTRRALCHEQAGSAAGAALAGHVASLVSKVRPGATGLVVAGYWPKGDEADIRPAMETLSLAGHVTALPVVAGRGWPLLFRQWRPGHPLVPGAFRVMEPMEDAPVVQPDLLLVPLLAFDDRGYRLGYGGGFYDRTLEVLRAAAPALALGIGYAGQRLESVPIDAYDQKLDWIVTEEGVRHPA